MIHPVFPVGQIVQPIDILSGLGAADRPLLSACIALFEDSTLARRLSQLYGQVKGSAPAWLRQVWEVREIENVAASVQSRVDFWDSGDWSDDDLRLIAWIYLREAFALPERLCLSERGAARICDDLAAAAIAVGAPLLVDGQEFQVKCLQGLDGLTEHFSKFEYPVLANAELAEAVAVQAPAWADKVFFVEGYSHDLISQITPDSLAAGSGLVQSGCAGVRARRWRGPQLLGIYAGPHHGPAGRAPDDPGRHSEGWPDRCRRVRREGGRAIGIRSGRRPGPGNGATGAVPGPDQTGD
jgi:hypothetical protein